MKNIGEIYNMKKKGLLFLDETQRTPKFVCGIIQSHLFHACKNKKTSILDFGNPCWHGDAAISLCYVKECKMFAIVDGGHRIYSFEQFIDNQKPISLDYDGFSEMEQFFKKLKKRTMKEKIFFNDLTKKEQKMFLSLELNINLDVVNNNSQLGEILLNCNKQKQFVQDNVLNAKFAGTNFFKIYANTAECISKFNGVLNEENTPSWYEFATANQKKNYLIVCNGLKATGKKKSSILKLLLRSTDCASFETNTSYKVHAQICENHAKDSISRSIALIENTIDNMSIVPKLLDNEYIDGLNVWTAVVYTFGSKPAKDSKKSKESRNTINISGRFLEKNREAFNDLFCDCITGFKKEFKGVNKMLTNNSENGIVFNQKMLRDTPQQKRNTLAISFILNSIYFELV